MQGRLSNYQEEKANNVGYKIIQLRELTRQIFKNRTTEVLQEESC